MYMADGHELPTLPDGNATGNGTAASRGESVTCSSNWRLGFETAVPGSRCAWRQGDGKPPQPPEPGGGCCPTGELKGDTTGLRLDCGPPASGGIWFNLFFTRLI